MRKKWVNVSVHLFKYPQTLSKNAHLATWERGRADWGGDRCRRSVRESKREDLPESNCRQDHCPLQKIGSDSCLYCASSEMDCSICNKHQFMQSSLKWRKHIIPERKHKYEKEQKTDAALTIRKTNRILRTDGAGLGSFEPPFPPSSPLSSSFAFFSTK